MSAPNTTAAILTCTVIQGAAIYRARQAGTWPAPRQELGIVSVGLLLLVATRINPMAKWLGVLIALAALAGIGTKPQQSNATVQASGTTTAGGRG